MRRAGPRRGGRAHGKERLARACWQRRRRLAFSRSAGKGLGLDQARISAPDLRQARTSSVSRLLALALMRRPGRRRPNSRNAWAVVAKPVGTRTPCGSWEIISPRLAFCRRRPRHRSFSGFQTGTTRAVGLKSADMGKLQKLKPGLRASRKWPRQTAMRRRLQLCRCGCGPTVRMVGDLR